MVTNNKATKTNGLKKVIRTNMLLQHQQ